MQALLTLTMYLFMRSGLLSNGSHCLPRRGWSTMQHSPVGQRHSVMPFRQVCIAEKCREPSADL